MNYVDEFHENPCTICGSPPGVLCDHDEDIVRIKLSNNKLVYYTYECHNQPCAEQHDGVIVDLRIKTDSPPAISCPMCGEAMTFCGRVNSDSDGYKLQ